MQRTKRICFCILLVATFLAPSVLGQRSEAPQLKLQADGGAPPPPPIPMSSSNPVLAS